MPYFSIITATYNAEKHIERLIFSLMEQTCRDFEFLIIDGASTDNTAGIVEKFRPVFPKLFFSSGPDHGVYDAWGKIFPHAEGQWVLFLGADDALAAPTVLEKAKKKLDLVPPHIHFGLGHLIYMSPAWEEVEGMLLYPEGTRSLLPYMNPMGHAAIFHRRVFLTQHFFDTSFRILGDYDFFCKYWQDNMGISLGFPIAKVALGGLSNDVQWMAVNHNESKHIRKKYFPGKYYNSLIIENLNSFVRRIKSACKKNIYIVIFYNVIKRLIRNYG